MKHVVFYFALLALSTLPAQADRTAAFTSDEYDSTARLGCGAVGAEEFGNYRAGILRTEDGTWKPDIANGKVWQLPLAALEGG